MKKAFAILATACLTVTSTAVGQIMLDPSTITVNAGSVFGPDNALFVATNLLDGEFNEGNQDSHQGTHWIALEGTFQETVDFVFNGSYELTALKILNTSNSGWNDSETDFFTIATSNDGGATFVDVSAEMPLQDFSEGFQDVPLSTGEIDAVRLTVRNEDADDQGTNDVRVGLNEVQFFRQDPAVPEPSSLAFLGLGALVFLRRKR